MTFDEVKAQLELKGRVEVGRELTAGEYKAVREGLAVMRVYQDQPHDIPYPFRPKKYYLIRVDG